MQALEGQFQLSLGGVSLELEARYKALGDFSISRRQQLVRELAQHTEQIQREKSELIHRFVSRVFDQDDALESDILNPEEHHQIQATTPQDIEISNKTQMKKMSLKLQQICSLVRTIRNQAYEAGKDEDHADFSFVAETSELFSLEELIERQRRLESRFESSMVQLAAYEKIKWDQFQVEDATMVEESNQKRDALLAKIQEAEKEIESLDASLKSQKGGAGVQPATKAAAVIGKQRVEAKKGAMTPRSSGDDASEEQKQPQTQKTGAVKKETAAKKTPQKANNKKINQTAVTSDNTSSRSQASLKLQKLDTSTKVVQPKKARTPRNANKTGSVPKSAKKEGKATPRKREAKAQTKTRVKLNQTMDDAK